MAPQAGCRWSTQNWSCAYDSVFMALFYIFMGLCYQCSSVGLPLTVFWENSLAHSIFSLTMGSTLHCPATWILPNNSHISLQDWLLSFFKKETEKIEGSVYTGSPSPRLKIGLEQIPVTSITLILPMQGFDATYHLQAILYHGSHHFMAWMMLFGQMWNDDGRINSGCPVMHFPQHSIASDEYLSYMDGCAAHIMLYVLQLMSLTCDVCTSQQIIVAQLAMHFHACLSAATTLFGDEELPSPQPLYTPVNTATVLMTPSLVQEIYMHLPMLTDILAWSSTSQWTCSIGKSIATQRFTQIIHPFVGDYTAKMQFLMYAWGAVITGFYALQMLAGEKEGTPNLNIVVPSGSFNVMQGFILESLKYHRHDMIFMTPGGNVALYPEWTLRGIAVINHMISSRLPGKNVRCIHGTMAFLLKPCGDVCPALWLNIADACTETVNLQTYARCYTGVLYATAASTPVLMPVSLHDGVSQLRHINDLEVLHWVDCLGDDKFNIDMACAHKTYTLIGHDRNNVVRNVLVLKHTARNKHNIVKLTVQDIQSINSIIRQTIDSTEFWT
ncbi:hypothetical protein BD769DRAFT_1389659 [Suillus cothurnatus]|nr:hypothetical protein BD769DRAFT_1389659 [Suillus cothurnatus]